MALAIERRGTPPEITEEDVVGALGVSALRYGRDDHYDVISAFIKSIRGSDPDAGLYWLARMLEAGEDARFIARRLVILASEDVGMADPQALLVAVAAAQAVEHVGLPEAQLNLASGRGPPGHRTEEQPVRAGDLAGPRGRAVRPGWGRCRRTCGTATTAGAKTLGHGRDYVYPHDDPRGWVPQRYRPPELDDRSYYEPSGHGEADVARRQAERSPPRPDAAARRRG